ncbi:hypothetical protein [Burkholderia sp. GS2Y]|uniref:Uncharacterized protein n=1 Tax=Burkholderia theae TaxID=3143496 RepID=A0ABU9WBV4_9BURK
MTARAATVPRVIFIREFVRFPLAASIVSLNDLPVASAGIRLSVSMRAAYRTSARFIVIASWPSLDGHRFARRTFPQLSLSTEPLR